MFGNRVQEGVRREDGRGQGRLAEDGAMPEKCGRMEVAPRKDYSADTVALAR